MSKNSTKEATTSTKTPFYKKAVLPWLVIATVVVFFAGVVSGWTMRTEQEAAMDSVRQTALAEAQTAKK